MPWVEIPDTTYLSYIVKYKKEQNSFLVCVFCISANHNSVFRKYYTTHQSRCSLQAADIQVDIKMSVQQTEIDLKCNAHAWNLCKLGASRSEAILVQVERAVEGYTWLFSHETLFSRVHRRSLSWEYYLPVCYRYPNKKMTSGSLWPLEWGFIILSSNDHANPAPDSQHPCAPTLTLIYSRDFTDAYMILTEIVAWFWYDHLPLKPSLSH